MNDLTKVIQIDSNFYVAYINKATILRRLGKYKESIEVQQVLLKRKKTPEEIFGLGVTYEKSGNLKLANEKYKEALAEYDKYLKTPRATSQDMINKQFLMIFIQGKDKVLKQINSQLKKNPDNTELLMNKIIIEEFNRREFVSSF